MKARALYNIWLNCVSWLKCEFKAFLDKALREWFVCSLRTQSIQKRLLSEATLDLKKVLEVALGMEVAEQTAKHMHIESPGVHRVC